MSGRDREAVVESLAQTGEGVVRLDGKPVLVARALPGERVRVSVGKRGEVRLLEVLEASPSRVNPPCPVFERCGACTWQHLAPAGQQDARLAQLRRALPSALRDLAVASFAATAGYGYRTRARLAWRATREGVVLGFRARASHDLVDLPGCPVLAPSLEPALATLRAALGRVASSGEVSLGLGAGSKPVASIRPDGMPDVAGFAVPEGLLAQGFAGVALWAPGASAPALAGDPRPMVRGADGAPVWLALEGFAQANEEMNPALAAYVAAQASASGKRVLELYAGAGNFTVLLARDAKSVTAVESDRAATEALRANVDARGLTGVRVIAGDAEQAVAGHKADVIVLDPPRTGARAVAELLAKQPSPRVVYVSCDPPTLGRDLGTLMASMDVVSLAAFEMFPQTPHLEVVATLERRRGRRVVR